MAPLSDRLTAEKLLKKIGSIRFMERCKVTTKTHDKANGTKSTYYALQHWDQKAQKTKSLYVLKRQVEALKRAYEAYQEFKELVRQYEAQIILRTRAKLGLLTKGSKVRARATH